MVAVISLLAIVLLSIIVLRVATIALTHTGLSRESARFQARSALTGVGFTTTESEQTVNHPVRRRIIMILMLLGNAGIVTAVSSLILAFVAQQQRYPLYIKLGLLALGILLLWLLARSRWVDNRMNRIISWALKNYTDIDVKDYTSILHLAGGYMVSEILVQPGDWLAYRTLQDTKLSDEGVLVLGIRRENGMYLGAPRGETMIQADDKIICYGPVKQLKELEKRKKGSEGDLAHRETMTEQQKALAGQN